MKRIYFFCLVLLVGLVSCDNDQPISQPLTEDPNNLTDLHKEDFHVDDADIVAIQEGIENYFSSLSNEDFEKHVEYVYPRVFEESDSAKRLTVEMMSKYSEEGLHNRMYSQHLTYVSPLVKDSLINICLIKLYHIHDIVMDENFNYPDGPLLSKMKGRFGEENVSYDKEKRIISGNGISKFYAIKGNDGKFTFLDEGFVRDPRMSKFIEYSTVKRLKAYESESNK